MERPTIKITDCSEQLLNEDAEIECEETSDLDADIELGTEIEQVISAVTNSRDPTTMQRSDYSDLGDLLRQCAIRHAQERLGYFWSPQRLEKIMTEIRIADELSSYTARPEPMTAQSSPYQVGSQILNLPLTPITPKLPYPYDPQTKSLASVIRAKYLGIFATLVLIGKGSCIEDFIAENIEDTDLPLIKHAQNARSTKCQLYKSSSGALKLRRVECLLKTMWATHSREGFLTTQYSVKPAILTLAQDDDGRPTVRHVEFGSREVLPFVKIGSRSQGGFGIVSQVEIHPDCHEFGGVLKSIQTDNKFALKELRAGDRAIFEQEADMLKEFNGFSHDHIVALLMTWTRDGGYCLLFPMAGNDLEEYWINNPTPTLDSATNRWIAKQIVGMASALQSIHEPKTNNLQLQEDQRFGRHGDLKPENVLWYPSPTDEKGILVLADFGLTKLNSVMSRSFPINTDKVSPIEVTPRYKSPECDLRNQKMSRDYDIWTFGCLLLEFICWALEGQPARSQFLKGLFSPSLSGSASDTFFDIQKKGETGKYVALVKEKVSTKLLELHQSPHCTLFYHELLYLIEEEMIVVLGADKPRRISAAELHRKVADMYKGIINGDPKYQSPCKMPRCAKKFDPVDGVFKYHTVPEKKRKRQSGTCSEAS